MEALSAGGPVSPSGSSALAMRETPRWGALMGREQERRKRDGIEQREGLRERHSDGGRHRWWVPIGEAVPSIWVLSGFLSDGFWGYMHHMVSAPRFSAHWLRAAVHLADRRGEFGSARSIFLTVEANLGPHGPRYLLITCFGPFINADYDTVPVTGSRDESQILLIDFYYYLISTIT